MGRTQAGRGVLPALALLILLPPFPAHAVIPSAFGPIQALLVILPQLLVALGAALIAALKPRTYKVFFLYLWTHKVFTVVLVAVVAFAFWAPGALFGTRATAEKSGAAWAAFRGGPGRSGAVEGSKGVVSPPRVAWKLAGEALGTSAVVDSSPAVVGNRIYAGVGNMSPFGASGSIVAVDADTGGLAWKYSGKGDLDPTLRPVFSSPAVAVEGKPPAAKYLVSGEGYHEDRNCRMICLDLEPVSRSGGKEPPKLLWHLQTTSHVESAPCIHEGRACIGAGDDGLWCVELATGKVLWHLEGAPFYEVTGPKAADLGKSEGKVLTVTGTATRIAGEGKDDVGVLTLEAKTFSEAPPGPFDGRTFDRAVRGRIERKDGKVRIVPEDFYPDCESPPIVIGTGADARLFFGSGVGGNAVICVNAVTGARIWKSATPYPAFGALTVAGDRVILGVGNGNFVMSDPNPAGAVLGFSIADGKEAWRTVAADTIIGAVAVHEGRAYACGRDGNIYAANAADGGAAAKLAVGSPMVCSPAVAGDTIYASTTEGKVFALDRKGGKVLWSMVLTPEKEIFSSPTVSGGRLFVGTRSRGLVALEEKGEAAVAKAPKPWLGPGCDAGRTGCADDRGLPPVEGDTADLKWPGSGLGDMRVRKIMFVEGLSLIVSTDGDREPVLKSVDIGSGRVVDAGGARPPAGALETTAFASNLRFDMKLGSDLLSCSSDVGGQELWSVKLDTRSVHGPSVLGDRVFVPCAGKGDAKGFVEARKVVDGSLLWRQPLDEPPASHVVASGDWAAVAMGEKIAVFRASDGKAREPVPVGGPAACPALCRDVLVVVGQERIAAYDLASSEWLWNYKDQDNIGTVTGQPVVAGEVIWVGTTKKGLVAIGVPGKKGP
jgi:outer membrane protein assembly factor BamB